MTDRAVRFDRFGGPEVLEVVPIPEPHPGAGEVRVRVVAAGLNPVDWKILSGAGSSYPVTLPSGNGNDFAGVVDGLGSDVDALSVGDRVAGGLRFLAQADHLVIDAARLVRIPDAVGLDVASTLDVVGRTAYAALDAVALGPGDTLLVSGASGGLGSLVVQLARLRGASVVGLGSPSSADRIRELGATPVAYGDGVEARIREAAPDGVDAAQDCAGHDAVRLALDLGVAPDRINTNADHDAVERWGVHNRGAHTDPSLDPLVDLVGLIASGEVTVTIAAEYPLEAVREAYEELMGGHTPGKIVLRLADGDR